MLIKEVSYAHQGCIYLIKNTEIYIMMYSWKNLFHKKYIYI